MALLNLTLPSGELAVTGKQVSFASPCSSGSLEGVVIENNTYSLVDSDGSPVASKAFLEGNIVSIILNVEEKKAYVQNSVISKYIEDELVKVDIHLGASVSSDKGAHGIKYQNDKLHLEEPDGSWKEVTLGGGSAVSANAKVLSNNWRTDSYATSERVQRICFPEAIGISSYISAGTIYSTNWEELTASFTLDSRSSDFLIHFLGGPWSAYTQPYDIADIQIYADGSQTNLLSGDIRDYSWGIYQNEYSSAMDMVALAYNADIPYIHIWQQTSNLARVFCNTGATLEAGTYVIKMRMRLSPDLITYTMPIEGVKIGNTAVFSPLSESAEQYSSAEVKGYAHSDGKVHLIAKSKPASDMVISIISIGSDRGAVLNVPGVTVTTDKLNGAINTHNSNANAHAGMFAPAYSYGTEDLTAGVSKLETGKLHFVYE